MVGTTNGSGGRSRRRFLTATGIAAGVGLVGIPMTGVAADRTYDTYRYHGHAPAPVAEELVVQGNWAFVASKGISTVDLHDPTSPTLAGRNAGHHHGDTADVDVDGNLAALTHNSGDGGVSFFDISDPANPEYLDFYRAASHVHNLYLEDGYAYLTIIDSFEHSRLVIVDATGVLDGEPPETLEGPKETRDATDVADDERGTNGSWMLRDARTDMAEAGVNPLHDIFVHDGLAYLCYWEAGIVVVDVSGEPHAEDAPGSSAVATKTNPVAVAHFGAVDYADDKESNYANDQLRYVGGGQRSNAHYVQPSSDGDFTFVGSETFPGPAVPPGGDEFHANGDHGGIRVFDTTCPDIGRIEDTGTAVYPRADGVSSLPARKKDPIRDNDDDPAPGDQGDAVQKDSVKAENNRNVADMVAYIPAPEQPDDVALTAHNFDVTDTKLFTSWYQGGIRAYDIADPTNPEELAAFAPDGTAFWTAENLAAAQGDTYFTVASDIAKGAVVLELTSGSGLLP